MLDDVAGVHDHDVVGLLRDDAHVVRNQEQRRRVILLDVVEQSRTLACTVTSSAVGGSSAISSFGRHAMPIAIITYIACVWPLDAHV